MARKNEHAHLSAVARYCCRADEVETSAVFNIFMLVDVNGTKSHAVYDDYAVREVLLATRTMHTLVHAWCARSPLLGLGLPFSLSSCQGTGFMGLVVPSFFPLGSCLPLFPAAG